MIGKKKAFTLMIVHLLAQLLDGLLTWTATPDLSLEGNPLVAWLGLGWGALFTANALMFLFYCAGVYYSFAVYTPPQVQANNWREYVSMLLFGRPDRFRWVFYKLRLNWRPVIASVSYGYAYGFIIARCVLIFEWLLHLGGVRLAWYDRLARSIPLGRVDMVVVILVVFGLMVHWFGVYYRKNQRQAPKADAVPEPLA